MNVKRRTGRIRGEEFNQPGFDGNVAGLGIGAGEADIAGPLEIEMQLAGDAALDGEGSLAMDVERPVIGRIGGGPVGNRAGDPGIHGGGAVIDENAGVESAIAIVQFEWIGKDDGMGRGERAEHEIAHRSA